MSTSLLDKILSDLMKKIDKLINRIEVDLSGFNCREILIHNKRLDILKKNIEVLKKQESIVREKYVKYEKLLTSNELILGKFVKIGIVLIIVLSIFLALFYVEAVMGFQTISTILPGFVSRENLPYVSTSTASIIGLLSVIISITYGLYRRRVNVLAKEYSLLKNKYVDLLNRVRILESEYEKSYKYRTMPRVFNLCKCHVELSEFREKYGYLIKY